MNYFRHYQSLNIVLHYDERLTIFSLRVLVISEESNESITLELNRKSNKTHQDFDLIEILNINDFTTKKSLNLLYKSASDLNITQVNARNTSLCHCL